MKTKKDVEGFGESKEKERRLFREKNLVCDRCGSNTVVRRTKTQTWKCLRCGFEWTSEYAEEME